MIHADYHGYDSALLERRASHDRVSVDQIRGRHGVRVVVVPSQKLVNNLQAAGLWEAFASIDAAIRILTSGVGVQAMDLSRIRGGTGNYDHGAELLDTYRAWVTECKRRYFSPLMLRDMMIDSLNLEQIEAKYKFGKGAAHKNLINCLNVWLDIT